MFVLFCKNMIDFQKIRNKQKGLFFVIAIVVIFSFVILFTPDAEEIVFGQGRQTESGLYGQITLEDDEQDVTLEEWRESRRMVIAQMGPYASNLGDDFLDTRTVQILREKALMGKLDIQPTQSDTDAWISELLNRGLESLPAESKPTRQEALKNLFLRYGAPYRSRGDSEEDVQMKGAAQLEAFARYQVGNEQLRSLGGVSGVLVSAKEAEIKYREDNLSYVAEGIFLNYTNYLPLVQASEDQLKKHYTNTLSEHRIPEKRRLSYVTFPATNYLDEAEKQFNALDVVNRDGFLTNYWPGITILPGYKTNSISALAKLIVPIRTNEYAGMKLEEATANIREEILTKSWGLKAGLASVEAYKAGLDFQKSVEATHKAQPALDTLEKMALLQNLTATTTMPVSDGNNPVPGLSGVTASQIFGLSITNAFIVGDPFSGGASEFYIASLKQIIPSRNRSYAEAKNKVTTAYKKAEGIKLMKEAGQKIYQSIKDGKSLDVVAKENNISVTKLGPFNSAGGVIPNLDNKANSEDFRTQALGLETGETSELITSSTDSSDATSEEAAFVVKLTEKIPVSREKFDSEFPAYLENERSSAAARGFADWLQRQTAELYRFTLKTYVEGEGTVEVSSEDGNSGFYKQGTRVKIIARPAENFDFKEWSGGVIVNTAVATNEVVVSRNTSVTASFVKKDTL